MCLVVPADAFLYHSATCNVHVDGAVVVVPHQARAPPSRASAKMLDGSVIHDYVAAAQTTSFRTLCTKVYMDAGICA